MRIPAPGTGRVALALMAVAPAAMAYPWQDQPGRWAFAVAAATVLGLFAWWRGLHLTTIVRRRVALLLRGGRRDGAHQTVDRVDADGRTTVVLRVLDGADSAVPLDLIRGYLDRYALRCESLRISSRDTRAGRTTWISATMSARTNLTALQARSAQIPLRETAEITGRRLADHLREHGWSLTSADLAIPDLPAEQAREHWRAVSDTGGHLAAYSLATDSLAADRLPEVLDELWSHDWDELWTVVEMSEGGLAAGCAIRTTEMPPATPPLPELISRRGRQRAALHALNPGSTIAVDAEVTPADGLSAVRWSAFGKPVRR